MCVIGFSIRIPQSAIGIPPYNPLSAPPLFLKIISLTS